MAIIDSNYSFSERVTLFFSLIYTKIFWPKARLIRKFSRIRGKKGISYGRGFTTGYAARICVGGDLHTKKLIIGENVVVGDYIQIEANSSVTIGKNVLIASRVFISDTSHGNYSESANGPFDLTVPPNERDLFYKPVVIGDNVWVGENVCILPGVEIGNNCVIGAGSIVTKSFPNGCIIAGNPAKVIKTWNENKKRWEKV